MNSMASRVSHDRFANKHGGGSAADVFVPVYGGDSTTAKAGVSREFSTVTA